MSTVQLFSSDEPKCPNDVTGGMLTRLYYEQEPGGGWTRDLLIGHTEQCVVCRSKLQDLSAQDKDLQERFRKEVLADARMADKIRAQQNALRELKSGIAARNTSEPVPDGSLTVDFLGSLRESTKAGKILALVRALQKIASIDSQAERLKELKFVSTSARHLIDEKETERALSDLLERARTEKSPKRYVVDDKTQSLILSMLSDRSGTPSQRNPF